MSCSVRLEINQAALSSGHSSNLDAARYDATQKPVNGVIEGLMSAASLANPETASKYRETTTDRNGETSAEEKDLVSDPVQEGKSVMGPIK